MLARKFFWFGMMFAASAASIFATAVEAGEVVGYEPSATQVHQDSENAVIVKDKVFSMSHFEVMVKEAIPKKYYHGQVPEGGMEKLRFDVAIEMALRFLQMAEADRLGIKVDDAVVDVRLAEIEQRYRGNPSWEARRDKVLPRLRADVVDRQKIKILKARALENISDNLTDEAVLAFYEQNSELFTEPRRDRVRVILLKVDPSSPKEVWEQAEAEANKILEKIRNGTDFAKLAKLHSADKSAEDGGDLGYLHQGMLSEQAQELIAKMKIGEISEPFRILEGYSILKLESILKPILRKFKSVKSRSRDLLERETRKKMLEELDAELLKGADVTYHKAILEPYLKWKSEAAAKAKEQAEAKLKAEAEKGSKTEDTKAKE